MKTLLFLLALTPLLLVAKTVKPKVMHAQDREYQEHYSHSSNHRNIEDEILSSSVEATGQITVTISLQISTEALSEVTSEGGGGHSTAHLSYLDNNRIQITEDIAKGEGEYLETLLNMMNLHQDKESLKKIQNSFEELIYLSHNDFLDKLESLV
jgi:glyoxylase-like metal-dependent hydrolase (beta-lactamase superfamily II)